MKLSITKNNAISEIVLEEGGVVHSAWPVTPKTLQGLYECADAAEWESQQLGEHAEGYGELSDSIDIQHGDRKIIVWYDGGVLGVCYDIDTAEATKLDCDGVAI